MMNHKPVPAVQAPAQGTIEHLPGYYGSIAFVCPDCGRSGKFLLRSMGTRFVQCDGRAFKLVQDDSFYRGVPQ